eukprot:TRINITY_DN11241_c0_g1_i1.p1 TRINITY_DN11241_c0_g1~~TRINITY_DN11241_c0_g1_i1.p1  ORF type:complete len:172 (-),score=36.79 TRINITY_DN11241_c0_g1_i1:37-492(-)
MAADGTALLGELHPWDFNFQSIRIVDNTQKLMPGDRIRTTCVYNTIGNTKPVSGGEETLDEMCFNFLFYYPRMADTAQFSCVEDKSGQVKCPGKKVNIKYKEYESGANLQNCDGETVSRRPTATGSDRAAGSSLAISLMLSLSALIFATFL